MFFFRFFAFYTPMGKTTIFKLRFFRDAGATDQSFNSSNSRRRNLLRRFRVFGRVKLSVWKFVFSPFRLCLFSLCLVSRAAPYFYLLIPTVTGIRFLRYYKVRRRLRSELLCQEKDKLTHFPRQLIRTVYHRRFCRLSYQVKSDS